MVMILSSITKGGDQNELPESQKNRQKMAGWWSAERQRKS